MHLSFRDWGSLGDRRLVHLATLTAIPMLAGALLLRLGRTRVTQLAGIDVPLQEALTAIFAAVISVTALVALVIYVVATARGLVGPRCATVVVDARGLVLGGVLEATLGEITSGWMAYEEHGRIEVRVARRRKGLLRVHVESEEEANALLRALGHDASQAVATFGTSWPALSPSGVVAALLCSLGAVAVITAEPIHAAWMGQLGVSAFAGAALAIIVGHTFFRATLTVGQDGLLRRAGGRRDYVSFDDIESIHAFSAWTSASEIAAPQGIAMRLRDGRQIAWEIDADSAASPTPETRAVLRRVEGAMSARRSRAPSARAAACARRDREPDAWLSALYALGSGADADHRTAPMGVEELWSVVEDTRARVDERAGAAVALRAAPGAPGGMDAVRLRAAARVVAEPRLRALLDAVSDDDEKAIVRRLAALRA